MSDRLNEETLTALLVRLKDSPTETGWKEFVARYEPLIRAWCRRRGLSEANTDDVAQNVLLKLTRILPTFEYDPAKGFRKWLRVVVENAVNDYFREQLRQLHTEPRGGTSAYEQLLRQPDAVASLAESLSAAPNDRHTLLHAILEELRRATERHQWEAFERTEMQQQSAAEAAAALGMTTAAVYQARYRLKKKILERMTALEQETAAHTEGEAP
jgi:RNA polymerase sigma factor (sigma-70 family)